MWGTPHQLVGQWTFVQLLAVEGQIFFGLSFHVFAQEHIAFMVVADFELIVQASGSNLYPLGGCRPQQTKTIFVSHLIDHGQHGIYGPRRNATTADLFRRHERFDQGCVVGTL